jgi:hypothetical protein
VRDIWAAVRDKTPQDALIFTDETGREPTLLAGWNTYAFHGQRQVYLSTFYTSRELRNDEVRREARLKSNEDVLSGRVPPTQIHTRRNYGGFYAVVQAKHPMPLQWQLVYSNQGALAFTAGMLSLEF